ncbi:MAG TPA: hypothetical protein VFE24_14840 [Pirellulales bacterium]|jgi:hypothetical protein|nr:hypothetical protein [Pirellulales bacterium]
MIEPLLQAFVTSRYRRGIVITLTFLTAVAVGWPAADDYFGLRDRESRLSATLKTTQATVAQLSSIERQFNEKMSRLHELDSQLADEQGLNEFRSWVVDQIRQTGCQMRKVRVGTPGVRRWRENGDPFEISPNDGAETPYNFKTIGFTLSASGSAENVKALLARLQKADKLMQAKRFSLHPDGADGKEIVLDLELVLFDLQEAAVKENKAA